jgi:hypothetical protein
MPQSEVIALIYQELLKVVGGAVVILAGLSVFLSKVWSERIARREGEEQDRRIAELKAQLDQQNTLLKARLDASIQKTVHVGKVQFEHEYAIYKQAWEQLVSLKHATTSLRPVMDQVDPSESREDRMRRRAKAFAESHNAFLDVIEQSKPFYPNAIYEALSKVRERCHHELVDYEYVERPGSEYYKEAMKGREEIFSLIDGACAAIRERIAIVSTSAA